METSSKAKQKRSQRDYSMAFKLQVIAEVEKGELSYKQAQRKYGIQGRSTVLVWLRKHSILDWSAHKWKHPSTMSIEKTPEQKIKELEVLLAKEKEKVHVLNVAIDIADELFKTEIRKKYLPKQSKKPKHP
ncbi:helix-turn-helix domain-containing protein [Flectobacillus longus]|jgi:transposase-like protein|uniref:helix-turn-helix domain-containing protein n=1 Tax=Flectobacillus longus TaxID=2984207 RepID=UPI0035B59E03